MQWKTYNLLMNSTEQQDYLSADKVHAGDWDHLKQK